VLLSAGLCPAWQRIVVLDELRPGATNQAREVHEVASGKPVNVGVALHCLGAKCRVLVPLGGATGDHLYQELTGLGVRCRFVRTAAATRVCTTVVDRSSVTELVEPAPSLNAADIGAFVDAHRRAVREARVAVLSGPLPRDVSVDLYAELLGTTPCPAVVDASGDPLIRTLALRPLVITASLEDLEDTLAEPLRDETRLVRALRDLERRGARWLAVTRRADDLVLVGEGNAWRLRSPSALDVANSAGFADCLVAGIALGIDQGLRVVDAARFGLGTAADNAATLLPARVDPARVSDLTDAVEVEPWRAWHGGPPAEQVPAQN
jgi:1-phosphofructokinase family hexose kinase